MAPYRSVSAARFVTPHNGSRDDRGRLKPFKDAPAAFRPNLTPRQMLEKGMHGGIYFNPMGGKPGVRYPRFSFPKGIPGVTIDEFPSDWFKGIPKGGFNPLNVEVTSLAVHEPSRTCATELYLSRKYSVSHNCYKVKSGLDQAAWEEKGWITEHDPRGWTQWYFRFYMGRRLDDGEDERQISRWLGVAGEKGRWKQNLIGKCLQSGRPFDDPTVSPVVRQTLLHWAYELTEADFGAGARRVKTHGAYGIPADQLVGVVTKKRKSFDDDSHAEADNGLVITRQEQADQREARAARRGGLVAIVDQSMPKKRIVQQSRARTPTARGHADEDQQLSLYEQSRLENIEKNKRQLAVLGL